MTSTPSDPWGEQSSSPSSADPFSGDPHRHNPFGPTPAPDSSPPGPYAPGPLPSGPSAPGPQQPGPYPPGPHPPGQAAPVPPDPYLPAPYTPAPGSGGPGTGASAFTPAPGQIIVQVGEIGVTSSTVHTPAGDIPLAGSTWQVSDYWHHEQRIPQWAIIAAIAGFCVLTVFSLLFLLVKETISRGTVQVTVTNGIQQYVARIQVTDQNQVGYIHQQVNYIRSLAAL